MLKFHQIVLCFIFCFISRTKVKYDIKTLINNKKVLQSFSDYSLESVRILNETSRVPGYGTLKLNRTNLSYPKIFAEIELLDDLRNYDVQQITHCSTLFLILYNLFFSFLFDTGRRKSVLLGNKRYILLPFKIYRQPICKLLNVEYRNRAMHDITKYSNFPFSEDKKVNLCDLMPVVIQLLSIKTNFRRY